MGYPPYMGGWLIRAAYGLKDAPRLWWNKLDASLRSYGLKHTRAGRCCYVWHGPSRKTTHPPESLRQAGLVAMRPPAFASVDAVIWEAMSAVSKKANFDSMAIVDSLTEMMTDPIAGSIAQKGDNPFAGFWLHTSMMRLWMGQRHFWIM